VVGDELGQLANLNYWVRHGERLVQDRKKVLARSLYMRREGWERQVDK